jgi:hypothetical protein
VVEDTIVRLVDGLLRALLLVVVVVDPARAWGLRGERVREEAQGRSDA